MHLGRQETSIRKLVPAQQRQFRVKSFANSIRLTSHPNVDTGLQPYDVPEIVMLSVYTTGKESDPTPDTRVTRVR